MHLKMCCMRDFCSAHTSRKILREERRRRKRYGRKFRKVRKTMIKRNYQQEFIEKSNGLLVGFPSPQVGNLNTK